MEDLAEFSVKIEPPVSGQFREYTVYTCDAWCQGPVVAQTLQMLEDDDLAAMGHNSTEYIHLVSQALDLAYADRHAYYGDPDLVDVPIKGLLSKGYTRSRRADVDMRDAFPEMPEAGAIRGRIKALQRMAHQRSPWQARQEVGCRTRATCARLTNGATRSRRRLAIHSHPARSCLVLAFRCRHAGRRLGLILSIRRLSSLGSDQG